MAFDAHEFLDYFGFQRVRDQDAENIMASCHNDANHNNEDRKRSFGMLKQGGWRPDIGTGKMKWIPAGTCNCYVCGGWTLEQLTAELLNKQEAVMATGRKWNEYEAWQFLQSRGWLPEDEPELSVEEVQQQIARIGESNVVQTRKFPVEELDPYLKGLHKMALRRGDNPNAITVEMAREFKLGWDPRTRRIIIPVFAPDPDPSDVFSGGKPLVGVISRAVDPDDAIRYGVGTVNPEWRDAMNRNEWFDGERMLYVFDKGQYLFGEDRWNPEFDTCLVLESALDVVYAFTVGLHEQINIAATFGSKVTRTQLTKLLSQHRNIIEGLDNDLGGQEGRDKLYRDAMGKAELYHFDSWGRKDLGECTPEEAVLAPTRIEAVTLNMFSHLEEMT